MKKIIVAFTLIIAVMAGNAQESQNAAAAPTLEQRVDKNLAKLTEKLSLTPEQQSKVKAVVTEFFVENDRIASSNAKDAEYKKKISAASDVYVTKIEKVLTQEQKTLFTDLMKKYREKLEAGDRTN